MKSNKINKETVQSLAVRQLKFDTFSIGDKVEVSQWVQEGDSKRIQTFLGNVIARSNNAGSSTFTVRKIAADDVAVERIYPLYSPIIENIKVIAKAKVRRAKLYYLRSKVGESARIKEKVVKKADKQATQVAA
ncbi:50S ribosomal protein L19 [candidate division TM6 bacterium RIFCSPHIGHO2_12_FULL_38_8]|nr:MAG: 50S ribosomal protein L19 [candidate division TM6 bacterium RIFCSPHIGHO2_12_FULL_38_8]